MAYIFHSGKMASDQLDSALTNGIATEALKDGYLVKLGDLADDKTYAADGKEYDVYKATVPALATDEVAIIDFAGISEGAIGGNIYKMGSKLTDLEIPANVPFRVRRLHLHDKFWLGESNFASTPTVGQFALATGSDGRHTPAGEAVPGQYNVKILVKEDLTQGMRTNGAKYLVEVVDL